MKHNYVVVISFKVIITTQIWLFRLTHERKIALILFCCCLFSQVLLCYFDNVFLKKHLHNKRMLKAHKRHLKRQKVFTSVEQRISANIC